MVPDVRGAGIPAHNERMVSAYIHEHGRRIFGESAVAVMTTSYNSNPIPFITHIISYQKNQKKMK
jgi:hypothetical protein